MTETFPFLADANILDALREHARWQSAELVEQDGLLLMADASGFPAAFRNCVARVDSAIPADQVLVRANEFFGSRKRGFTLFVCGSRDSDLETLLREKNFTLRFDTPGMLVDRPVTMPVLQAGIRIEEFTGEQQARDAVDILADAYQAIGLPPQETRNYFPEPARLLSGDTRGCVAYDGNQPLATALTITKENIAGVYWVGTAAAARGRGLASACTAFLTNDALARGATFVTLQASKFGEPVYRRLGYQEYGRFKLFRQLE